MVKAITRMLQARLVEPQRYDGHDAHFVPASFYRPDAGVRVSEEGSLQLSTAWACVRVIAGALMSCPLTVRRELEGGGSVEAPEHPAFALLHGQANPEMPSSRWIETAAVHLNTWGNHYSEIELSPRGLPVALWPIHPARVTVTRNPEGTLVYEVASLTGQPKRVLTAERVLHIPGMGFDGLIGYSPVRMAAQSISAGLAVERFGAQFFGNNAFPGVALMIDQVLKDPARKALQKSLSRRFLLRGRRAFRPMVVEGGGKLERMSFPPDEAQFVETRKWGTIVVCQWFGTPPFKVGYLEHSNLANVEQQQIEFLHSLLPWASRFEAEIQRKLIEPFDDAPGLDGSAPAYAHMNLNGLLRADMTARGNFYKLLWGLGALSSNDVRRLEDMAPVEGGDLYLIPVNNMAPLDMVRAFTEAEIARRRSASVKDGSAGPARGDDDRGDDDDDDRASSVAPATVTAEDIASRPAESPPSSPPSSPVAMALIEPCADAVQRLMSAELNIAQRSIGKGPESRDKALRQIEDRRDAVAQALRPFVEGAARAVGGACPASVADDYADRHVAESALAVRRALESASPQPALAELASRWQCERAPRAAADLIDTALARAAAKETA